MDLASGSYGGERGASQSGIGKSPATGFVWRGSEWRRGRESTEGLPDG